MAGTLACADDKGRPIVAWTTDAELVVSVIRGEQRGPTLAQLYAWWSTHS